MMRALVWVAVAIFALAWNWSSPVINPIAILILAAFVVRVAIWADAYDNEEADA